MSNKNRVIWSSEINVEDWKDFFEEERSTMIEEYDTEPSEDELFERAYDLNNSYLEDERDNFSKIHGTFIAFADVGTWRGVRKGHKLFENTTMDKLLYSIGSGIDGAEWFVERYDLKSIQRHHDGTNYITFREVKDNVPDTFWEKLENGSLTEKEIARYTKSVKHYIKEIYGW